MEVPIQTEKLLAQIREAFQGVELGEGVSLHQALVIDCYGSDEEQQQARAKDEQHDWQKMIAAPDMGNTLMNACSFLDEFGARFHLPVCLSLLVLNPELNLDLLHFLEPYHYKAHRLLSEVQRQCTRDVLHSVYSRLAHEIIPYIGHDLLSYWDATTTDDDRHQQYLQGLENLGCIVTHTEVTYTVERIDDGKHSS